MNKIINNININAFVKKDDELFLKNWSVTHLLLMLLLLLSSLNSWAYSFILDSSRTERPKVGLVLSGGGAKGFAHIGVLKVIRDAGIEFDYISGTSMGSIVGGLYAMGYSPEYIEELIRKQDWTNVLIDKIERRDLSLDVKTYNEQQFINFPVTKKTVSLPFGIKYGQSVSLLLSKLVSPVHQIQNFKNLQTPFLCIATDISNGESVVLDHGNLAESMRASMAIPTLFTPVIIDGKLLVDGGLVNNFPAKELAERGCDIIIGVDVQNNKKIEISDLNSITSIIDRSASFYREALNDTASKYVDYYMHPDIEGYGVGSFTDYDSIMIRGERCGKEHWKELKALGDYLHHFPDYRQKTRDLQPLTSFTLDTIIIIGNKGIPSAIIKSVIPFEEGEIVEMNELETIIKQMYGSLFFNTVKYSLKPGTKGSILIIKVEETSFGSIGLGVHYDTDYNAGLLLSSRFRNVLFNRTMLEVTLGLSEHPHASIKYYQNRGLLPSFGVSSTWSSFSFVDYRNGKDKIGEFRFNNLLSNFYIQSQSKKTVAFGLGLQLEFSSLYNNIGIDFGIDNSTYNQTNFNFFLFAKVDRWDRSFFPHRGGKVFVRSIFVTEFLTGGNVNFGQKVTVLSGEYDKAIPLGKRWTLRPRINAGFSLGQGVYFSQLFLLGGQGSSYLPGMVSFTGLNIAQLSGTQLLASRVKLQYNFYKKHYILATVDLANVSAKIDELFIFDRGAMGYGLTYGYDSFFGPVELSVMGSNYRGFSGFLNLGFWF